MNPTLSILVADALADQRLADAAAYRRVQMLLPEQGARPRLTWPRLPSAKARPAA